MRTSIPYVKTPTDAYLYLIDYINRKGDQVIDENGYNTKELLNIQVTIIYPCDSNNWPIPNTGWTLPALNEYVDKEIISSTVPSGFLYSYGNRLFAHPPSEMNQIEVIIKRLENAKTTRRAVAGTLSQTYDCNIYLTSIPCLQLIQFLYRDGKLNMTAVFRSWDVKRAGPANLYGLSKLLEYVANRTNMPTGELTVFAIAAHVYED